MTVSSEINKSGPYFGNDVTTEFDYEFKIFDATHLKVIRTEGGVPTVLVLNVDYTVTGVGDEEGKILTTVPPTSEQSITMVRNVPFLQKIDLENQGAYYPETVEQGLDLAVMRDQQLAEEVSRAIKIPPSSDPAKLDETIGNVLLLVDHADEIDTVALIAPDVETVSGIAAAVQTVSGIAADVQAVSGIAADVENVAANMPGVLAAPGAASDALASKNSAEASASAAATSEENAAAAADAAGTAATNAATSATAAEAAADRAENVAASGVLTFDTYADAAAAASLSDEVKTIIVAGRGSVGDWGDAVYEKVATEPEHAGLTIGAAFYKNVGKDYTPEHFGAKGDGLNDDGPAISEWILASADEGRKAVVRGGKTYIIEAPISCDINKDLCIEGVKGSVFKGAAGDGVVLEFKHNTDAGNSATFPNLSISGLIIDNSLRNFVSADQSGTALSLIRMKKAEIFNCIMQGGIANNKGDSGITAVTCVDLNFHDNLIKDQPDLGIYMSGGPTPNSSSDDYGEWKVYANQIINCNAGFAPKRETRRVVFCNNILRNILQVGYLGTAGALGTGNVPMASAREQIIMGNVFSQIGARAIELEVSKNDIVVGNQIEDFGYAQDGITPSAMARGIRLLGVQLGNISSNVIALRSWANTANHYAITLEKSPFSPTQQSLNNIVSNNMIVSTTNGIVEMDAATGNRFVGNHFPAGSTSNKIQTAAGSTSQTFG